MIVHYCGDDGLQASVETGSSITKLRILQMYRTTSILQNYGLGTFAEHCLPKLFQTSRYVMDHSRVAATSDPLTVRNWQCHVAALPVSSGWTVTRPSVYAQIRKVPQTAPQPQSCQCAWTPALRWVTKSARLAFPDLVIAPGALNRGLWWYACLFMMGHAAKTKE